MLGLVSISHSVSISMTQMFLFLLLCFYAYLTFTQKNYKLLKSRYALFFLLFYLAGVLSVLFGIEFSKPLKAIRNYWIYMYLFMGLYFVKTEKDLNTVYFFTIIGGIISSVYALINTIAGSEHGRAVSFMTHALTLGNMLAIIAILCLTCLLYKLYENRLQLYTLLAALPLIYTAVFLTGSRGPILAAITVSILIIITKLKTKGIIPAVIIVLLALGAVKLNPPLQERFTEIGQHEFSNPQSSIGARIELWRLSAKIIKEHPIFGIGFNNFRKAIAEHQTQKIASTAHAHNIFVQHLVLHGVVGLSTLFLFFGYILKRLMHFRNHKMIIPALWVMAVFIICGMTENTLGDSEVVMLFLFILGSALGPYEKLNQS
ncbi:MAG TPA: hypothetical protein DCM31_04540 [Deferribacteraceae bacterium]|nr:hypothetical protein [Deferribacteraceae bacterium]